MLSRLSTAVAALLVAVWLGYQGLGLLSFARNANAAELLTRPGDRYYITGGLAIVAAAAFGVAGVRVIFRVASQRSPDVDEDRLRFLGHHRHGA